MSGRKDYEEKKEIKRQIYEERVIKAEQKSKEHYSQHQKISSSIPLGQPILIDHYSANRHRSDINKMDNAMRKSIAEDEKAEEYRKRVKSREHATYELQNISQEIRRLKARIKELKILDELDFQDIIFKGGKAIHNKEQNRIQILFDDKPNEEVRTLLKRYGFTRYYKLDKENKVTEKCIRKREDSCCMPENYICSNCGEIFGGTGPTQILQKKEHTN